MWTVVYMTHCKENATELVNELDKKGLINNLRSTAYEGDEACYEVLVPDTSVNEAHRIMIDISLI